MTDFIKAVVEPIMDFLTFAVGKFGTKFVIALVAIGSLVYMAYYKTLPDCPQWLFPVGIAVVAIMYFVFRSKQELGSPAPEPPTEGK